MSNNVGNIIQTAPAVVIDFWEGLKPTSYTIACPRCNAQNFEVRRTGRGRPVEHYIFHHNTCLRVYPTDSKHDQVMRALVEDARTNALPPDQSEHDTVREAEEAYTIALQDALADAQLSADCPPPTQDELFRQGARARAIEEGDLVDVSGVARRAGFTYPMALTRAVWATLANIPDQLQGIEDLHGRLWDIVWTSRSAAMRGPNTLYTMNINRVEEGRALRRLQLKLGFGPGDQGEPVVTIMLPDEL
jgi:hypothetical protein